MNAYLPPTVEKSLGSLVGALAAEGFAPTAVQESRSFGDFAATFSNGQRSVTVCRDRGQFIVQGERSVLEPAGLWQSFTGWQSLLPPLVEWLRSEQHE